MGTRVTDKRWLQAVNGTSDGGKRTATRRNNCSSTSRRIRAPHAQSQAIANLADKRRMLEAREDLTAQSRYHTRDAATCACSPAI